MPPTHLDQLDPDRDASPPRYPGLIEPGDEPDRPYDFAPPATARRRAKASLGQIFPTRIEAAGPEPVEVNELGGFFATRSGLLSLCLIVASVIGLVFAGVAGTTGSRFSHAILFTLVTLIVRPLVMIVVAFKAADWCDVELGGWKTAAIKLTAISLSPGLLAALAAGIDLAGGAKLQQGILDPFTGQWLGAMIGAVASLFLFFLLFHLLFQLPADVESGRFTLLLWAVQLLLAGLVVHMFAAPPPRTPHYVPTGTFHFSWGN